jgi:hypothetical protein
LIGLAADIDLEEFSPNYEETANQTNARFGRKLVEKGQGWISSSMLPSCQKKYGTYLFLPGHPTGLLAGQWQIIG